MDETLVFIDEHRYIAIFILMAVEFLVPKSSYNLLSKHKLHDLIWFAINENLLTALIEYLRLSIIVAANAFVAGTAANIINLEHQSPIIQFLAFLVLLDFTTYWVHRLSHNNRWLWELHKTHHSAKELTVLSNYRYSWIEAIIAGALIGSITGIMKVDSHILVSATLLDTLMCYFLHSNIRIKKNWLNKILLMPDDHRWHHALECKIPKGQNFGITLVFWDKLFNTYYQPNQGPNALGLNHNDFPESFIYQALYPFSKFFPKAWTQNLKKDDT